MAETYSDWIAEAMVEIGVVNAVDPPLPEDSALGLKKINRIFDNWNAEKAGVWAYNFDSFTLSPNVQPHTIGLAANTPTFAVPNVRPNKIYGAMLVLNTVTPAVNIPINIVSHQWWLNQTIPTLATSIPTDLYYQPDWPNGSLFFWPVPTIAYGVLLEIPVSLVQGTLQTAISAPPGYKDAVVLTLAEDLLNPMKVELSPTRLQMLTRKARQARARIFAANDITPSLATQDAGMPSARETGERTTFNYRNRSWN